MYKYFYHDIIYEKVIDVLKVLILRHIYGYNFCESCSLGLLRVLDSCEFSFSSTSHDFRVWVVTKLVSEPRFSIVGPRLLEFEFSLNYYNIRFEYVFEKFSLLLDFLVTVRMSIFYLNCVLFLFFQNEKASTSCSTDR